MNNFVKLGAGLGATILISTAILSASPAFAAESQCPSAKSCGWKNEDFLGDFYYTNSIQKNYVGDKFNDSFDTIKNERSFTMYFFKDADWAGANLPLGAGASRNSLSGGWHDSISSLSRYSVN